jgi:electron transport complex protein RnfC
MMIKQSFIGLAKPQIEYEVLVAGQPEPQLIQPSEKITLFLEKSPVRNDSILFNVGDKVKTGQKLSYSADTDTYVIASVTGTISSISAFAGDYGKSYTAISVDVDNNEELDDQFAELAANPTLDTARNFLSGMPGNPSFKAFSETAESIHTIIICGVDRDLLITTNQYAVKTHIKAIKNGIGILKQITGVDNILMTAPQHLMQDAIAGNAQVRVVDSEYPATLPHLMMQSLLDQVVPAGKRPEEMGVCFLSAEAVASIGRAFDEGRIPVTKTLTLVDKNGDKSLVSTIIGTPISDILNTYGITLHEKDRLIIGGPMTGSAVYSEDYPVQADTDAIIVQDSENLDLVSDYPCINCGDCVRICPANIPINMLVRFLEAGQYEEAADQYDLYSCIDCGLCSYVCVSKMPVFHYIKLAKYELGRMHAAEAMNA